MGLKRVSLPRSTSVRRTAISTAALRCRRKFLKVFPKGFQDETYIAWERGYKQEAHERWSAQLGQREFAALLRAKQFSEIASRAVKIESRTNLLFSFEKMALRDAVKSSSGAELFAKGIYAFLHGRGSEEKKFEHWCDVVARLPRKQTLVLTWPVVTVFCFIAQPEQHIVLKPNVTKRAAEEYEFHFEYASRPSWRTYQSLLDFATRVRRDMSDLAPQDMIDVQSFLWVQGSDEYE